MQDVDLAWFIGAVLALGQTCHCDATQVDFVLNLASQLGDK